MFFCKICKKRNSWFWNIQKPYYRIVINKNPKIESTHKGWFEELNNKENFVTLNKPITLGSHSRSLFVAKLSMNEESSSMFHSSCY